MKKLIFYVLLVVCSLSMVVYADGMVRKGPKPGGPKSTPQTLTSEQAKVQTYLKDTDKIIARARDVNRKQNFRFAMRMGNVDKLQVQARSNFAIGKYAKAMQRCRQAREHANAVIMEGRR